MIGYTIMMGFMTIIMLVVSIMLLQGNSSLVHEYNLAKVEDKQGFTKALGKKTLFCAVTFLLSGVAGICFDESVSIFPALAVLLSGSAIGVWKIQKTVKKYEK